MARWLVLLVLLASAIEGTTRAGEAPSRAEMERAVREGLVLAQGAAQRYPEHRDCFACHHQTLPMLAMNTARQVGQKIDDSLLQDQADFTLESFQDKIASMRQGKGVGGASMTVGYALWALQLADRRRDATTDAMVEFLLSTQKPDGRWTTGNRPPLEESTITCTVLAAQGLRRFAPPETKARAEKAEAKAIAWLAQAPLRVQEDRVFRLLGLLWLGESRLEVTTAIPALLEKQRDDGGWPSRDDLPSDAYATGQTLAALSLAGLGREHPAVARGLDYLLKTRKDDGSWRVVTRSKPIQVDFDNGDPHGKNQFISTPASCWAVVALARYSTSAESPPAQAGDARFDLLIRGGRVVDGTGNPWFDADVGIRGDRVVFVGRVPESAAAAKTLDARGLIVAPGFIDMHSHSDTTLLEDGAALSKVYQGVTTEVLGEDSSGGPAKGKRPPRRFERSGGPTLEWSTFGEYLDAVEKSGTAVNVASYVGLGTLLDCVLGDTLARPNAQQLDEVASLLDEALREGAFGLSTMLAGARELDVTTDDLVALGKVVRRHGGIVSSHIRNEGTEVFEAVGELISVAERAAVPVDIIHLKIAEQTLWGRMGEVVARIEAARARGINVQANVYPYTRGNNDLATILPPWAHDGGTSALLARLRDPAQRERIKADIRKGLPGWYNHYTAVGGDWSRMLVSARLSAPNAEFQGKTMDVILEARGRRPGAPDDRIDRMLDFVAEEKGSVSTIYAHHTEADMNLALRQPWCSIGSDGLALAIEGPLRRGHPHPRSFGTFPRILGVYVRQRHLLTLEDAIRKMTSLNAAKIGLKDRGLLRVGQFADVTVFDPDRVIDRSTYLEPFQYSEGIRHVVVNGRVVLDQGKPTAERSGRALRHGRD
ncbi:MAG: amidohydrolase family protein [Isosphaeraceae bacterium]